MQKSELLRLICGITKERSVGLLGNCFAQGQTLYKEPNMNPETTTFMKMGKDKGATVLNGYQMLVEQAEASWSLWMNPQTNK